MKEIKAPEIQNDKLLEELNCFYGCDIKDISKFGADDIAWYIAQTKLEF